MGYSELIDEGTTSTEMRKYLIEGETVAITIRIPKNLRDSAKEAAALRGTSFSALLRECLINELTEENNIE